MKFKNLIINSICYLTIIVTALLSACTKEYTVTIQRVINNTTTESSKYDMTVKGGSEITFADYIQARYDGVPPLTGMQNTCYFNTDALCRIKFVGKIESNMTLYFGEYSLFLYGEVSFYFKGKKYFAYREFGETLSADDFAVSAFGYGDADDYTFWSDEAHTMPLNINNTTVSDQGINIYVTEK